ncbi:MAG: guanylate kinase [Chloroflexota bacterium]
MTEMTAVPRLFVLSGPSGVGKDAVIACLKEECPGLHYTVTVTTRRPRPGEADGVHYHFVTLERFRQMVAQDELLEWALVYGQHYGTPRQQVKEMLALGRDVLLKIDVQGAAQVRNRVRGAVSIFIAPSSLRELRHRLAERNSESDEEIEARWRQAEAELAERVSYDYCVVNRDGQLRDTVTQIRAIISAEHCRVHPRRVEL